jgi:AraC-like DNA-binding protein
MQKAREPRIKASILDGFEAFAARKGIDIDAALTSSGLTRAHLSDSEGEISLNAAARFLASAADQIGDPCLGLHWAEAYSPEATSLLGYLLLNAETVRKAVRSVARYLTLVMHPVEVSYEEESGFGHLMARFPVEFDAPRPQFVSFAMALLVSRLRKHAGRGWMPVGVDLEHRALPCRDDVLRTLGPNVRFNQPANILHIREWVLDRGSADVDRRLFDLIRQLGERMLAEQKPSADILQDTRKAVLDQLANGAVRVREVAEVLGLGASTLQTKLAAAGTTYDEVLTSTRRSMSDLYLRDTELPLTEIAFLLGFSELSAFTRAAQRWYGMPPSQRRQDLRR